MADAYAQDQVLGNLRKNIGNIGNVALQLKMKEKERQQELADKLRTALMSSVVEGKQTLKPGMTAPDLMTGDVQTILGSYQPKTDYGEVKNILDVNEKQRENTAYRANELLTGATPTPDELAPHLQSPQVLGLGRPGMPQEMLDREKASVANKLLKRQATSAAGAFDSFKRAGKTSFFGEVPDLPEGFVMVGNKPMKDPTYKDPDAPLPPSIENRKIKATDQLYDTVKTANVNYDRINRGLEAAKKLPQGFLGKAQMSWMKMFDTKNPTLGDWQNMKSLLTDAQLQQTAKTKGAISDREMLMFADAVSNDDMASVMRQSSVLDAFKQAIFADQESKLGAFQRSFKEDPRSWEDLGVQNPFNGRAAQPSPPAAPFNGKAKTENSAPSTRQFQVGQVIPKDGKNYTVVGFDQDGEPLVEPA